ncbi:MAG TPA: M12 family metallopeptidase [Chitinophagaceae bacterium]|nr:M12 family metallopeptidase [Chitinophagaceae bacterium]
MVKNSRYRRIVIIPVFIFITAISQAQQTFTITASKANNYCNSACTLFDRPDLNGNPDAVLFVTAVAVNGINLNPHPICAYYINKKWSVINIDNSTMAPGSQFDVTYYSKPDDTHFVHVVTKDNLVKYKNSYIDHAGLNNNPAAQFNVMQNWSPSVWGGNINRNEIKIQYDEGARKWYIANVNEKYLEFPAAYNIVISNTGNPEASSGLKSIQRVTEISPVPDSTSALLQNGVTSALDISNQKENADGQNKFKPDSLGKGLKKVKQPGDSLITVNKPVAQKEINPEKILPTVYDFSNVHICMDQPRTGNLPPRVAIPKIPRIKSNGEIEPVSSVGQELSVLTDKMWAPGTTITVGFFDADATPFLISKVKTYAKVWETFANIKFQFVPFVDTANVKVGFKPDGQSWSWLGRDVMTDYDNLKTVNFGWFNNQTSETEFRRVIVHEFGHVLGFIHEHSAPAAGIPWDKDKAYAYFRKTNGWGISMVDSNVFKKYSATETNSSAYDRLSIMHYFFPADLVTDHSLFTDNTNLSATDMEFARKVYPFPAIPPTATGILLTGDDCDEIRFKVEYDVVGSSDVEFILAPGRDPNGNLISWWKAIAIPVKGGGQSQMEMQDGYSVTRTVAANSIDRTRGITFGKAKILGVHTGLTYTWNPWPAIIPRCRVTLIWQRDKCGGL